MTTPGWTVAVSPTARALAYGPIIEVLKQLFHIDTERR